MAMQETPGSIRTYFVLVGVLRTVAAAFGILGAQGNVIAIGLQGINVLLAVAMVIVGAMALKLLKDAPIVLHLTIWLNYGWYFLLYLLTLVAGTAEATLHVQTVAGLAIAAYLSFNVKRLSGAPAPS